MGGQSVRTVRSFCRICTTICGIEVDVDGDVVTRVRGDREHPFTKGYTCPKGRALPQLHHHPDRLEQPLLRVDDVQQPVPWDAGARRPRTRLRAIIERVRARKPVGIFFGSGIGMDAAGYRMQEALLPGDRHAREVQPTDHRRHGQDVVAHLVGGFPGFTSHIDHERARMVMYVGINPVVSHGHNIGLADPLAIDPRPRDAGRGVWCSTRGAAETARLATRHLAPRPGTDHAVLAFLVRANCCVTAPTRRRCAAPIGRDGAGGGRRAVHRRRSGERRRALDRQ